MTTLLIVRHALAAADDDLRLPGPELSLLPEGLWQARALADRLRAFAPAAVLTSDARRARQTGEVVAAACGCGLVSTPALREIDLGGWGGQTYASVVESDPRAAAWFADPASGSPPGGESGPAAASRVLGALQGLTESAPAPERVVVVGHAGSLRLALATALGMPLSAYWRLRLDCASLSTITWTAEGPRIDCLNDVTHLEPRPPRAREISA